jgi:hypothetical protein
MESWTRTLMYTKEKMSHVCKMGPAISGNGIHLLKPHTVDRYTSVVFSPVHRYTSVDGYAIVVGSLRGTSPTTFSPVHGYSSVDRYTLLVGSLRATLHTTFTVK